MKTRQKFFTLVEILAAVAIVGLLAALGFGTYSYAMNSARESSSKALIARIGAALDAAQVKEGYLPSSGGNYVKIEVNIDTGSGLVSTIKINGTALESDFQKEFLRVIDWDSFAKSVKDGQVEDAWGGAVYYCYPGKINRISYDLISPGADMKYGENQNNAPASTPGTTEYRDADGEPTCDDIANF